MTKEQKKWVLEFLCTEAGAVYVRELLMPIIKEKVRKELEKVGKPDKKPKKRREPGF